MTTHEHIIAAAKECDAFFDVIAFGRSDGTLFSTIELERFYAIAHEAGRVAEREECNQDAERYRWLCEQNEKGNGYFHMAIGARGLSGWRNKRELDNIIDEARTTK